MKNVRQVIGGLGNLMFKQAFIAGEMLDGKIPDLYVQSEKYWKKHSAVIKAMYSEGIGSTNKIALHIRRGDYVDNPFYVDLWKTDYYKRAIELAEMSWNQFDLHGFQERPQYIVFCRDNQDSTTDKSDRQWCRVMLTPLLGTRFELPPFQNTEIEDFNLMASCKTHIMANSSFSWWAAYLNPNADKKIICPKAWYSDELQRTDAVEGWTLI